MKSSTMLALLGAALGAAACEKSNPQPVTPSPNNTQSSRPMETTPPGTNRPQPKPVDNTAQNKEDRDRDTTTPIAAHADIQPEPLQSIELLLRARSADDARAHLLRRLERRDTDAGRHAGDEDPFTRRELPLGDQHVVHDEERERNRRAFLPPEAGRHGDRFARIHQRMLGKRARASSHHALAHG